MEPFHQRDYLFQDGIFIRFPIVLFFETEQVLPGYLSDEGLVTHSPSESHDQGTVPSGLPRDRRIQTDESGEPYQIEIAVYYELADYLCGEIGRAVTPHGIRIVRGYEHGCTDEAAIMIILSWNL